MTTDPPRPPGRRARVLFDGSFAGALEESEGGVTLTYDADWLGRPDARPVSLLLPLREEPYRWKRLHPFFTGLLPEGAMREAFQKLGQLGEDDELGLLLLTCGDAIGAVGVEPWPGGEGS